MRYLLISVILMFSNLLAAQSGAQSQARDISIDFKSMNLLALIEVLQKEYSANILISDQAKKTAAKISVPAMKLNNVNVSDILSSITKLKSFDNSNLNITTPKDSPVITIVTTGSISITCGHWKLL